VSGPNSARGRRPIGRGGLLRQPAVMARLAWPSSHSTRSIQARHGAHAPPVITVRGGGLAWPATSNRVTRCGETGGGQLTHEKGKVPGKAGPAGTHLAAAR
jgi:hypothetical protein